MTIDSFIEDFENASTKNKKIILNNLIDSDPKDKELLDLIKDYKSHLNDLIEQEEIEEDKQINFDIEMGKYKLMRCTKTILPFIQDCVYRVRIDDMSSELKEFWKDNMTDILENYISNIKPIIWIVNDNGLGTLKCKTIFNNDLNEYFKED